MTKAVRQFGFYASRHCIYSPKPHLEPKTRPKLCPNSQKMHILVFTVLNFLPKKWHLHFGFTDKEKSVRITQRHKFSLLNEPTGKIQNISKFGITTLSIITFSITTLSITIKMRNSLSFLLSPFPISFSYPKTNSDMP